MGIFFIEYDSFSFTYETSINTQYLLIYLLPYFSVVLLIYCFKKGNHSVRFLNSFILVIILVLYCVLTFSKYYTFYNQHFFILFCIFCFLLAGLNIGLDSNLTAIVFLLVAVYFYELAISISQIINNDSTILGSPLLTGTFQNSGIYACYAVVGLPFIYYFIFSIKNATNLKALLWIKRWLFFVILIFTLYILYYTKSRTSVIALIPTMLAMLLFQHQKYIRLQINKLPVLLIGIITCIAVTLFIYGGYYLFYLKRLSAFGRVLKWEITFEHWNDHFWFGTGLGRFTAYYPHWQAQYFQSHTDPPREYFLSAGESYLIFNEYLQLFKEVGFIGFTVTVVSFFYFFNSKSTQKKQLLDAAKATVIALLACSFTSYTLHVNMFLLLLAICFIIAITIRENKPLVNKQLLVNWQPVAKPLLYLILVLSIYASSEGIRQLIAVTKWNNLRDNYALSRDEAKLSYATLYPALKDDGKFLTEYGEYLLQDSVDCPKAVEILERAKKYFISRNTLKATATAYRTIKNYPKAIENYEWLSNYLPNLFRPKFELLKLYKESGNKNKVRELANIILSMPVKIPSAEVNRIKSETKNILVTINSISNLN